MILDELGLVLRVFRDSDHIRFKILLMLAQIMYFPQHDFNGLMLSGLFYRVVGLGTFLQVPSHHIGSDPVVSVHLHRRDRDIRQAVSDIQHVDLSLRFFLNPGDPAVAVRQIPPEVPVPASERISQKADHKNEQDCKARDF